MKFDKKEHKKFRKKDYRDFILAADIGGTNAGIGIFGMKGKKPELLLSFHCKSSEIKGLHSAINEVIDYAQKNCRVKITRACVAAAGPLSADKSSVRTINIRLDVNKKIILKNTGLRHLMLINDFEANGYAINVLAKKDFTAIKKAPKLHGAPVLVIGAGTGMGRSTLFYERHLKCYMPISSEAGHNDFPVQSNEELEMAGFIRKCKKTKENITYEDLLSGRGLANIYMYLRQKHGFKETGFTKEIDDSGEKSLLISKYRLADKTCRETFRLFKSFYARCAKNFALDCLPFGGIYITGGIAHKNSGIFDKEFLRVFHQNLQYNLVLKKMPIYLIKNPYAGLIGAAFAGNIFLNRRRHRFWH